MAANVNQTLDIRLVDRHRARILRDIRCSNARFTRPNYHFSLHNARDLDWIREQYDLFGFNSRDNVEFVCMYGYDTTLAEDVRRFAFLRSLPGAYVFTHRYRPVLGRDAPRIPDFFGDRADELIHQLVGIVFRQNMKSMEVYYHWLSAKYVETFGRLHQPLVDTLFRYNQRDRKGADMANPLVRRGRTATDSEPCP